ncbi:MAG: hypothetical protein ACI9VT_003396 [Psychroserpens sp.]|jgi:hypothetical protein
MHHRAGFTVTHDGYLYNYVSVTDGNGHFINENTECDAYTLDNKASIVNFEPTFNE